ncbi:MAG TPA: hypothetical protein VL463_10965 [Kofleriaceae bacterium]|nr:hypothetical protein [Kofleriaceae bacterium]
MNQRLTVRAAVAISLAVSIMIGREAFDRSRSSEVDIDEERLARELQARWTAAGGGREAVRALGEVYEATAARTDVIEARVRFERALEAEPELAQGLDLIVGAASSSPAYDHASRRAWLEVFASPEITPELERLDTILKNQPALRDAIAEISSTLDVRALERRLRDLNDGDVPSRARATELVLDHVYPVARLTHVYVELWGTPEVQAHVAIAVRDLFDAPGLRAIVIEEARTMVADPTFRAAAAQATAAVDAGLPDEGAIYAALHRLFATRAARQFFVRVVDRSLDDPDVDRVGARLVREIMREPAVNRLLTELLRDWS